MEEFLRSADKETSEKIMQLPSFQHVTCTPGTVFLAPSGFIMIEKTLGMHCFGCKRSFLPSMDAVPLLREIFETRPNASRGGKISCDIAEGIWAKRGSELL